MTEISIRIEDELEQKIIETLEYTGEDPKGCVADFVMRIVRIGLLAMLSVADGNEVVN
jgi:hypothetical protein